MAKNTLNRTDRELETRDNTARKRSWTKPDVLPSPTEEPGYVFRWIRTVSYTHLTLPTIYSV